MPAEALTLALALALAVALEPTGSGGARELHEPEAVLLPVPATSLASGCSSIDYFVLRVRCCTHNSSKLKPVSVSSASHSLSPRSLASA